MVHDPEPLQEIQRFARERIVLGGPVWVWNCGSTSFACGCGAQLTLSDRLDTPEADEGAEGREAALYR